MRGRVKKGWRVAPHLSQQPARGPLPDQRHAHELEHRRAACAEAPRHATHVNARRARNTLSTGQLPHRWGPHTHASNLCAEHRSLRGTDG